MLSLGQTYRNSKLHCIKCKEYLFTYFYYRNKSQSFFLALPSINEIKLSFNLGKFELKQTLSFGVPSKSIFVSKLVMEDLIQFILTISVNSFTYHTF